MQRVTIFLGTALLFLAATSAQAQNPAANALSMGNAPPAVPTSVVSVKTSAPSCSAVTCNASGSGCVQSCYRPQHRWAFRRSYSCGRSYFGYRYRHHGCYSRCR